jgi:hypothetical protein
VLGGLLCLTAAAAAAVFVRQRRQHGRAKQGGSRSRCECLLVPVVLEALSS